jgi:hypothetical protein
MNCAVVCILVDGKPLITVVPEYLPKRICLYRIPTHGSNGQPDMRGVVAVFCL